MASLAAGYRLEVLTGYSSQVTLRTAGNGVHAAVADFRGSNYSSWNIGHYCLAAHNVIVTAGQPLTVTTTVELTSQYIAQGYADVINNLLTAVVYPRGS